MPAIAITGSSRTIRPSTSAAFMARSSFTFRHAALGLLGSALALSLAGWIAPTPSAAGAATWREPEAPLRAGSEVGTDLLRVARIAAFVASAAEPRAVRDPFSLAPKGARAEPHRVLQPAQIQRARPLSNIAATDDAVAPALVGLAEQETVRGPARTAVFVARDGTVEFAGLGEHVGGGRFRISDVTADGVVLVNLKTGATARVVLQ